MEKQTPRNEPTYFSSLRLRNFRGFGKEQQIELAPLTFLVGPNSSGKSSLADALLLIAQSGPDFSDSYQSPIPRWNGRLVDLGSFKDASFRHKNHAIKIGLTIAGPELIPWRHRPVKGKLGPMTAEFEIVARKGDSIGRIKCCWISDDTSGIGFKLIWGRKEIELEFGRHRRKLVVERLKMDRSREIRDWISRQLHDVPKRSHGGSGQAIKRLISFMSSPFRWDFVLGQVQRVSSGRAGPKRWYPIADLAQPEFRHYAHYQQTFEGISPSNLSDAQGSWRGPSKRATAARRAALAKILDRLDIASSIRDSVLSAYHSAIYVKDNVTSVESNLIDVGYGASQVLPVLLACADESLGPLFVEQPEIHLHPKAQGIVADHLCATSKRRQVVVETHSAHMINRARIAVARGDLLPSQVIIHYVSRTNAGSRVVTIPIGQKGEFLSKWPSGFFDERYEDTITLLKLKGE